MQSNKQELIRKRAYEIWEAEGKIVGYDEDHWRRAEMEIEATYHDRQYPMTKSEPPRRRPAVARSR